MYGQAGPAERARRLGSGDVYKRHPPAADCDNRAMLSTSARLLNRGASRSFTMVGAQQVSILHPAAVAGGVRPRQWASTKAAPAVEGLTLNVDEKVQRTKHRVPTKR